MTNVKSRCKLMRVRARLFFLELRFLVPVNIFRRVRGEFEHPLTSDH